VCSSDLAQAVRGRDLPSAAQALVDLACARNGKDNITVVMMLVPWGKLEIKNDLQPKKQKRQYWRWACWGLAGLILLALLITGLAWALYHFIPPLLPIPTPTP
jgi:uncharacterized iron-regulated membrane protein